MKQMLKNKSGRFVNVLNIFNTPGNVVFVIIIFMVMVYLINFLLNEFFDIGFIAIGNPLRFLIIGLAISMAFYIVVRRQGGLERNDVFIMIILVGGCFALFYYLPTLLPEIFADTQTNSVMSALNNAYTNPNSPVKFVYDTAVPVHNTVQSIIPIP